MALGKGMQQAAQMNVKDMAISINMLVQLAPSSLWGEALHSSGLFAYLVKSLQEEQVRPTTNVETGSRSCVCTDSCRDLDRVHLRHGPHSPHGQTNVPPTRVRLGRAAAAQRDAGVGPHPGPVVAPGRPRPRSCHASSLTTSQFDNMSEPRHRKLAAMGMANLVSTGRHEVLDRLPTEICNMWLDVLGEIREGQSSESGDECVWRPPMCESVLILPTRSAHPTLHLYWDRVPESYYRETEGTPEYKRRDAVCGSLIAAPLVYLTGDRSQCYQSDPVRTSQLTAFIAACIAQAEAACGGGAALNERYLMKADPTVLAQIQNELMGRAARGS